MKTKPAGVIIVSHSTHLSEPTRRFLRGLLALVLALGSLIALRAQGQSNYPLPYNFNTFAGNAYGGNGTGSQAIFGNPYASALDSAGNIYVADTTNFAVRKITPTGVVTTLAGLAGTGGFTDGTGSDARFGSVNGIAVDKAGNVYVTDGTYNTVRKITACGYGSLLPCVNCALGRDDSHATCGTASKRDTTMSRLVSSTRTVMSKRPS